MLNLVGLLDLNANADGVDTGLDEDSFVFVSRNVQRRKEDFGRCLGLNLGDVVTLDGLRGKVGQRQRGREAAAYALQVRAEGLRLQVRASQLAGLFNPQYNNESVCRLTMAAIAMRQISRARCLNRRLQTLVVPRRG